MPKILVNFRQNKDGSFTLYQNYEHVFADMPVCICDLDVQYSKPIVVNIDGHATAIEKDEYEKDNVLYKIKINEDNTISEDKDGTPIYLPKNVALKQLRYVNGQIILTSEDKEE